ncbi:hypothetical protein WN51_14539 [Melipona quadrifasciata]|uniref:DUF7044 domain-containing protein n=1 Tax=Melipona quadrifasciata TaxID=166423 RepID=A0A0M9A0N8_9HYME|nr:hypothetical protein WN51_14539 [Melipona quadrifasciata]
MKTFESIENKLPDNATPTRARNPYFDIRDLNSKFLRSITELKTIENYETLLILLSVKFRKREIVQQVLESHCKGVTSVSCNDLLFGVKNLSLKNSRMGKSRRNILKGSSSFTVDACLPPLSRVESITGLACPPLGIRRARFPLRSCASIPCLKAGIEASGSLRPGDKFSIPMGGLRTNYCYERIVWRQWNGTMIKLTSTAIKRIYKLRADVSTKQNHLSHNVSSSNTEISSLAQLETIARPQKLSDATRLIAAAASKNVDYSQKARLTMGHQFSIPDSHAENVTSPTLWFKEKVPTSTNKIERTKPEDPTNVQQKYRDPTNPKTRNVQTANPAAIRFEDEVAISADLLSAAAFVHPWCIACRFEPSLSTEARRLGERHFRGRAGGRPGEFSGWKVRSSKLVNGMDSPWDNDVKIVVDDDIHNKRRGPSRRGHRERRPMAVNRIDMRHPRLKGSAVVLKNQDEACRLASRYNGNSLDLPPVPFYTQNHTVQPLHIHKFFFEKDYPYPTIKPNDSTHISTGSLLFYGRMKNEVRLLELSLGCAAICTLARMGRNDDTWGSGAPGCPPRGLNGEHSDNFITIKTIIILCPFVDQALQAFVQNFKIICAKLLLPLLLSSSCKKTFETNNAVERYATEEIRPKGEIGSWWLVSLEMLDGTLILCAVATGTPDTEYRNTPLRFRSERFKSDPKCNLASPGMLSKSSFSVKFALESYVAENEPGSSTIDKDFYKLVGRQSFQQGAGTGDDCTGCEFPAQWNGHWFQSGNEGLVTVNGSMMTSKGRCIETKDDKFLIQDTRELDSRVISLPISELLFSRTWLGEKAKKKKKTKKQKEEEEEEKEEEKNGKTTSKEMKKKGRRRMSSRVAKSEHGGAGSKLRIKKPYILCTKRSNCRTLAIVIRLQCIVIPKENYTKPARWSCKLKDEKINSINSTFNAKITRFQPEFLPAWGEARSQKMSSITYYESSYYPSKIRSYTLE